MKDIEIKTIVATEIAAKSKRTLYLVCYWNNGQLITSSTSESKHSVESYALSVSQHSKFVSIYKFEVDIPNFNETL